MTDYAHCYQHSNRAAQRRYGHQSPLANPIAALSSRALIVASHANRNNAHDKYVNP